MTSLFFYFYVPYSLCFLTWWTCSFSFSLAWYGIFIYEIRRCSFFMTICSDIILVESRTIIDILKVSISSCIIGEGWKCMEMTSNMCTCLIWYFTKSSLPYVKIPYFLICAPCNIPFQHLQVLNFDSFSPRVPKLPVTCVLFLGFNIFLNHQCSEIASRNTVDAREIREFPKFGIFFFFSII